MKSKALLVVSQGRVIGRVTMDRGGRVSFSYEESWRTLDDAFPLSLSMPLAAATHPHRVVDAFLQGLLPDSDTVLQAWARRFHTSRHPFSLLSHVGEDCAGAFQFVTEERLREIQGSRTMQVEWLTETEVADRIRALRVDPSAWRAPGDFGQFSLGGAQAKTSLLCRDGRWGVPFGRTPTTHILKPPILGFEGHVENEHLCLALARALGLPAVTSEVKRFADQTVIVVERYDRTRTAPILRLHQEDMCQALAIPPQQKYQAEGGPGPREIVALLRDYSDRPLDDVATFVDALGFNWLIGGTDAHGKNYAVLHGAGGSVRLAPLYDLASVLPYGRFPVGKLKLSMKIGATYQLREIDESQWRRAASELALEPDALTTRLRVLAKELPERLDAVVATARASGLEHPIMARMLEVLSRRASARALSPRVRRRHR